MTLAKPPLCAACSLFTIGQGYANGSGTGANHILLLGEALGAREAVVGAPFVGDAGAQLTRTLQRVQCGRDQFRINNVVRCRPPKNWLDGAPWEEDAINNCTTYFHDELDRHPPAVIVPMGNVPTNYLLGRKEHKGTIEDRRGYVYKSIISTPTRQHDVWVVPTYHPSFLMRGNQNLTDVQAIDIKRAIRVGREGFTEPPYFYTEHPTSADLGSYYELCRVAAANGKWLIADIETPTSGGATEDEYGSIIDADIIRISFSIEEHKAITIPWTYYTFDFINAILSLGWSFVVFWNQEFDVPRIVSKGCTINGKILDAMYMWHFLQSDLPKGLGYVSTFFTELSEWKSLSEELPEYYSCKDSDATIQNANKIRALLEGQGRFDKFLRHYVELQPYVITMANSGVLIDPVQQEKFRGEVQGELDRLDLEVQRAVPLEVKKVKRRKQWPADLVLGEKVRGAKVDKKTGKEKEDKWFWDYDRETGEVIERQVFLCTSPKHVLAYIKFRGHPVEVNYKTGKETTAAEVIDTLADKFPDDPLYPIVLSVREFRKIMGQYIDGYAPGPDGRVRTHFNRKPSTWRYNCVAADTLISTSKGEFCIADYPVGLGATILTHTGQQQRITNKFFNGVKEMILVHLSNGCYIKCTSEHTLLTPQGWSRVCDLSIGLEIYSVTQTRPNMDERGYSTVHSERQTYDRGTGKEVGSSSKHYSQMPAVMLNDRSVQRGKDTSVLTQQDGLQESYAWEDCREASKLERRLQRSQGASYPEGQWEERVHSQSNICGGTGDTSGEPTRGPGCASPGRGPIEQRSEQPVLDDRDCSLTITQQKIVSFTPLGPMEVWDIEVEEDHSYVAQGFINHNSEDPNVQNVMKRHELATEYRKQFVAGVVEEDFNA